MKASETWLQPMESSRWASDVLLTVTFEIQGDPLPPYREQELRNSFVNMVLRETNRKVEQFMPHSKTQGEPIDSVICIFSIEEGTPSVGIVFPDSQIIEITLKR